MRTSGWSNALRLGGVHDVPGERTPELGLVEVGGGVGEVVLADEPAEEAPYRHEAAVLCAAAERRAIRLAAITGIGVAGYSFAYLSFPSFMDEGVSVSGFVMNQWTMLPRRAP